MDRAFHLLITDRNPHVREFLKRELAAAGFNVRLARSGREILDRIYQRDPVDLLVLDPDLPDPDKSSILKKLKNRIPPLPVVIHSFATELPTCRKYLQASAFVEKSGSSVENLKQVIIQILHQPGSHSPKM